MLDSRRIYGSYENHLEQSIAEIITIAADDNQVVFHCCWEDSLIRLS